MTDQVAILEALRRYREVSAGRDAMVLEALAAGLNINRIHGESGISRATLYRIASTAPRAETPDCPRR